MAKNLPVSHPNDAPSPVPNRLQSTLYQKIIPIIFIILGSLLFLSLNVLAYYYGWRSTDKKPNAVISTMQKTAEMLEKQTGYTIMQTPGTYACDPNGVCNTYSNPASMGCPKTFSDPYCSNACGDPKVQCKF